MEFYRIRNSISSKVIGKKYPQVEKVFIPTTWDDKDFIQSYTLKKAPNNVLLPIPELYKSAKVTDFLSAATVGLSLNLLVSEKFKKIIEQNSFWGMQLFSVTVKHKEQEYPYWIIHPYDFYYQQLNLEQSFIGYYNDMMYKNLDRQLIFKNYIDLKNEINTYDSRIKDGIYDGRDICITKIAFKESTQVDFFPLRPVTGGIGFFVSEHLKNEIEKAGCTGIVFTKPNEQYP